MIKTGAILSVWLLAVIVGHYQMDEPHCPSCKAPRPFLLYLVASLSPWRWIRRDWVCGGCGCAVDSQGTNKADWPQSFYS